MGIKVFRFLIGRWNLVMLVIIVALTVILAAVYYFNNEEKLQRQERYNELKAIADLKTYQIIQWREHRIKDASVAYSQFFGKGIAEYAAGNFTPDLEMNLIKRLGQYETLYEYKRAFVADKNGCLILSSDSLQTTINHFTIASFDSVRKSKKIICSDVYLLEDSATYLVEVVAPVFYKDEMIAFMVLQDDPFDVLFPMIQSWPTPSESAETVIVRKDGDDMLFINELRHEKHTALKRRIPLSDTTIAGVQAILGKTGVSEAIDYRNVAVFSDLRQIPGTKWYMVTKVDKKEMFAELRSKAVLIGGLVIGILLILAAGLTLMFSYRQRNIYRELFKTENELATTGEEFRTTLYSIGDAVIICDNNSLVRYMNPVAEVLCGWKESEAKGMPLSSVISFISEPLSGQAPEKPTTDASYDEISDKAKHIALISRNGKHLPISATVSDIRDTDGKKSGKIFVFRDQTFERQAEEKLKYSEEMFAKLFQLGAFPTVLIRFSDNTYVDVNESMLECTGYSKNEIIGKTSQEIGLWKSPEKVREFKHILESEGIVEGFELEFVTKSGEILSGKLYSRLIEQQDEKFIISRLLDITEQKKSELALRTSEEHYRSLFERMLNGYVYAQIATRQDGMYDLEIQNVNPAFLTLTGLSEYKGKRISELIPGILESDPGVFDILQSFIEKQQPAQFEYYLNSLQQWFNVMAYMHDHEHIVILFEVITDRKKSELALRESEQRYRNTLDNMMEGCQILDKEWRYLYINQKAASFGELEQKVMLGKKVTDFFPDFESTEMFVVLNKCMNERVFLHREFDFVFPGNRHARFDFKIQPVPEGIFILSLDITEQHNQQELLESQYTMLTALINSAREIAIFSVDKEYRYTTFNEYHKSQIRRISGVEIKQGDNLLDILPASLKKKSKENIDKALAGNSFSMIDQPVDSEIYLDFHLNPIRSNDQIIGATIFIRDITENVLAQAEIMEAKQKAEDSERHYRLLAERMIDVIWVIDVNTLKFKYVSPSVETLSGYSLEKASQMGLHEILTPESLEGTLQELNNGFEKFKVGDYSDPSTLREMELRKADGTTVWTEVATSLVMNDKGEIELIGVSRDISSRKKVEQELKANEGRFRMLLELVPYPLAYVDRNRIISFRNQKFIETIGYTQDDINDMDSWWELAYPDPQYRAWVMEIWSQSVAKKPSGRRSVNPSEYVIRCKNGEYKVFEITGIDYTDGFLFTFIDITERKRVEDFDRLGHEVLQELQGSINTDKMINSIVRLIQKYSGIEAVGIRMKDGEDFPYIGTAGFDQDFFIHEKSMYTSGNTKGESEKDEFGNVILNCMCGKILYGDLSDVENHLSEGGSFSINNGPHFPLSGNVEKQNAGICQSCKNAGYESIALIPIRAGEDILGLIQLNDHRTGMFKEGMIPFFESLGNSIGLALMRDKAREELEKINTQLDIRVKDRTLQLEEANRELESFSYSVSHDLRAPLRHIGGFSEILSAEFKPDLPEKAQHYLTIINQSVKRMGNLIDDLLHFSRTGRTDMRKTGFDAHKQLLEVINELTSSGKNYPIEWEIAELPVVFGDSNLIRLVWLNLISNAIKYSQGRNPIRIRISYSYHENEHIFCIRDNGIGFDMKYVNKLFGVFQRLHSSDQFEGTGIGLANVRRIIARHGGRTWAESTLNEGATFYFSLPAETH
jgi:PAS domain S-box-containing protein